MKTKKVFLILSSGFMLFLPIIFSSCNTNNNEPCLGCFGDEPVNFRLINYEPAWSPDGKWIAFYHGEPGKSGIYLISPDGENIKKWHDGIPETPAWSPDSEWIAFSEGAQIWKKKIDGDSLTQLTFEGRNFDPVWGIKGIAYRKSYSWPEEENIQGIWLLNPSNGDVNQLFSGNCTQAAWLNPDNIVFFRGEIDKKGSFTGSSLYKIQIKDIVCNKISFLKDMDNLYPKFYFAGAKIAFLSIPKDEPRFRIWVMDADGSNLKQLTDTQSYYCDWSPDGKYIVYTNAETDNGQLWIMDADGTNKRQLTFEHHFINF